MSKIKTKIPEQPARKSLLNAMEIIFPLVPTNETIPVETAVCLYCDEPGYVNLRYTSRGASAVVKTALVSKETFSIYISAKELRNVLKGFDADDISFTIEHNPEEPNSMEGSVTYKCGRAKGKILRYTPDADAILLQDFSSSLGNVRVLRDDLLEIITEASLFVAKDDVRPQYNYIAAYVHGKQIEFYATNGLSLYRNTLSIETKEEDESVFFVHPKVAPLMTFLSSEIQLGWSERRDAILKSDSASIWITAHSEKPIDIAQLKRLNGGALAKDPIAKNISSKDLQNAVKRAISNIFSGSVLVPNFYIRKSDIDMNMIQVFAEKSSGEYYVEDIQCGEEVQAFEPVMVDHKLLEKASRVSGMIAFKQADKIQSPVVFEYDDNRYVLFMPLIVPQS